MRRVKYNNVKTVIDGIKFDSKKEAKRYTELQLLAHQNLISDLRLQVPFVLAPSVVIGGRKKPAIRYIADFVYYDKGKQVIEDVKGVLTDVFRIKRHLMMVQGNEIREV